MKYFRRFSGVVLILAGIIGLVLTAIAIGSVHQASNSVSSHTTDILDSANEGVAFLKEGTTKTQALLGETRERTQALDTTLREIEKKVRNTPSEKALLNTLDSHAVKQILRAQAALVNLRSTLEGFHNALVLFNSLEGFSKSSPSKNRNDLDDRQGLSQSLTQASENLDQISRFLDEVLTDKEVTLKGLNEVMVWVKQVQGRLAEAENRVGAFRQRLAVTEERISMSQKTVPTWIENGSLFAVLLLVCFSFTQIGLLVQGWSLLRERE